MNKIELKSTNGVIKLEYSEKGNELHIKTPNGHSLNSSLSLGHPSWEWTKTFQFEVLNDNEWTVYFGENVDEIKSIVNSIPIGRLFVLSMQKETINGFFDIASQTWCSYYYLRSNLGRHMLSMQQHLINHILDYDRECENAKYLKAIGTFFMNAVDRADILDVFSEAVRKQKEDSNVKKL